MLNCFTTDITHAIPITLIHADHFAAWLEKQNDFTKRWLAQQNFIAKPESYCCIPNQNGELHHVLIGQRFINDYFSVGAFAKILPQHTYELTEWHPQAALAWGLGAYQFTRYKAAARKPAQLCLPQAHNHDQLLAETKATYLVRDLINTPTEDMGPAQLAEAAMRLAKEFGAECKQIVGDDLLQQNYPAIHAVGRASTQAPRLIDLQWGEKNAPKITLIGKGVCFDTGGLDLKPASGMALMKKDMGGAAHVLGLAYLIMQMQLPIRLRVLIPAVENAVAGNAYRPGDIIKTRKGLTIEITNTDAEGRVILADALAEAASEHPELMIDMATLTGAARIAVGADIAAFFTNNDKLANALMPISSQLNDPLWRLPLHAPYRKLLDSPIADMVNASNNAYGGAITAALFLKEFTREHEAWIHFDVMAWNIATSPGRPEGGEAMGMRTLFAYLQQRFVS